MKKLVLSVAVFLVSLSTFATISTTEDSVGTITNIEGVYAEIRIDEIPVAVMNALKNRYPNAVINKAYVDESKEYRLDIKNGNQEVSLYSNANGNWIQK